MNYKKRQKLYQKKSKKNSVVNGDRTTLYCFIARRRVRVASCRPSHGFTFPTGKGIFLPVNDFVYFILLFIDQISHLYLCFGHLPILFIIHFFLSMKMMAIPTGLDRFFKIFIYRIK